jgi:hypothetical protein
MIKGKIIYPNKDEYEGECNEDGFKNGKGIMKYNNGEIYKGNWKDDKKNGNGLLCFNKGDMELFYNNINLILNYIKNIDKLDFKDNFYFGNFENDLKNGKGILFIKNDKNNLINNMIYEGKYKDDKKDGEGIYYFNDNNYLKVEYINDNINSQKKCEFFYMEKSNMKIYFLISKIV